MRAPRGDQVIDDRPKSIRCNRFAFLEGFTEKSRYGLGARKALQEQAVVSSDHSPAWLELGSVGLGSSGLFQLVTEREFPVLESSFYVCLWNFFSSLLSRPQALKQHLPLEWEDSNPQALGCQVSSCSKNQNIYTFSVVCCYIFEI